MEKSKKIRSILHCDLNNFYASVACHDNPSLKGKAVAVAGSVEMRHGIILAKNELAKKCGVKTAEPIWQARLKCPDLVLVEPDFDRYLYFSKQVFKIYERYTDMIESFGIDENWLDITGSHLLFGSSMEIAEALRQTVKREIGLTISVGVSFNKVFAKLGSDLNKPDGIFEITPENFKEKVWPLPVDSLLGVGKATAATLKRISVMTVGDLAKVPQKTISALLGKNGEALKNYANGIDDSPVCKSDFEYVPKSIGRSTTYYRDITDYATAKRILLSLSEEIAEELRRRNMEGFGVCLNLRTSELVTNEFSRKLDFAVQTADSITKQAVKLLYQFWDGKMPLRSVGVRVVRLGTYNPLYQFNLFEDKTKDFRHEKIERSVDTLRSRYGKKSVVRASLLTEDKPKDQPPYAFKYVK